MCGILTISSRITSQMGVYISMNTLYSSYMGYIPGFTEEGQMGRRVYDTRRTITLSFSDEHFNAFTEMADEAGMSKSLFLASWIEQQLCIGPIGRVEGVE